MKENKSSSAKRFRDSIKELCSEVSRQIEENAEKEYIKKKIKKNTLILKISGKNPENKFYLWAKQEKIR